MKIKYFIPAVLALVAVLTGCSDDDATYLEELRVSSSYVSLDVDGGSNEIIVNAGQAWSIDEQEIPEWLTVTPTAGPAGETTVTFEAPASLDGRTAALHMACGGKTQNINVIQGLPTVSDATCAEVIEGPESKTYRVTGTVRAIANTTYGNWYLADETGEIYIYGTLDAQGGTKNFLSLGIEVGDIVTVQGPKTLYGTTVELVDVTVISIQKSLIKVASITPEDATFPIEGGDITVALECKGNGVSVEIPEDAKGWLSIASVTGGAEPTVVFHAAANTEGDRSTVVTFKTTDDSGKEYSSEATLSQKGAVVTATIAEFLAAEPGDTQYRITGVIQSVANPTYGNVYLRDYSGEVYIYGIGSKGDFEAQGLKEGDVVTLVGKRAVYKDNAQMAGGQLEEVKPVTTVTIAEFLTKEDDANVYYRVSGTIASVANATYGNLYLEDGGSEVYVYGTYPGWGAAGDDRKNWLETAGIEVGDKLTVIGVKSTFKGTPQVANSIYFSHEKAAQ